MYPYAYVLSKETFDLLTQEGKNTDILDENDFSYEIIKKDNLPEKLFSNVDVVQSHIYEIFDVLPTDLPLQDIIIADKEIKDIPGYQDITDTLNESFKIIGIPYRYPFKVYIPTHINLRRKPYEFIYAHIPLAFSLAVVLYQTALLLLEESDYDEVVLLKSKKAENHDKQS